MATFSPKSLLTRAFTEQRSAECQDDGHRAKEDEAAAEAGDARDGADEGRPDEETEVAEDRDGRDRRATAAGAPDTPGHAQERRRRQGEAAAGDHEAREGDGRVVRRGRDDEPGGGRDAGEQHASGHRRAWSW